MPSPAAKAPLSTRQAEIAALVAGAKSNLEIARLLNLSERTVETHVAAIFNKLGVHSRVELANSLARPAQAVRDEDAAPGVKTNIPLNRPQLVGRDGEIDGVAATLVPGSLVTLTGSGGIGKTQTALAVGARLVASGQCDVWLVELASLAPGSSVARAAAHVLGIHEVLGEPLIDSLRANLMKKPALLILDNCEHVIDDAAAVAAALHGGCPQVRILATSREALRVAGEQRFRLPSLPVPAPAPDGARTASAAASYAAVALFARRAAASDRRFALTDANAALVTDICRRLDGIPLAIELAAARTNILSLEGLAAKLDVRFRILTGGDRAALPRQRTMQALFDWSYDLLAPEEQQLFEHLAVFAGGATYALVVAVHSGDGIDDAAIVELLASLGEKSLVTIEPAANPRYVLLESARQYAYEKLAARGMAATAAHRHARAFTELAEELERLHDTAIEADWLARVEPELGNFRAALNWALGARGDVELGGRLAAAMRSMWNQFSVLEGRRWLETARSLVSAATHPSLTARLDVAAANIAFACNEFETALTLSRRASATLGTGGDELERVRATYLAGASLSCLGRAADAEPLLRTTLTAARAMGNLRLIGTVLQMIAYSRSADGDAADVRTQFAEALEIWRAIGAERDAAITRINLAEGEVRAGSMTVAVELVGTAIATLREIRFTRALPSALLNLAAYLIACNRFDEARDAAHEALALARESQRNIWVACALQHLAAIAALAPDAEAPSARADAARILGYVDASIAALGSTRGYTEQQGYDRACAALDAALGTDVRARLMQGGAALTQEQALLLVTRGAT